MKNSVKIGGFKTQIWKALANDHLRPTLCHAFVRNGFIYATNAHIAVKQSLEHIHGIDDKEERETLEGKYFSEHLLRQLEKCNIVQFKKDGIHTVNGNTKAVYQYSECGDKYPDVDAVLPAKDRIEKVSAIGFNPTLFKTMSDAMMKDDNRFKFEFNGRNRAIVVTAEYYDREHQMGIIMPLNLND